MALSIDSYLRSRSYDFYISSTSKEKQKIDTSVNSVILALHNYFRNKIKYIHTFGSYTRGTIIPRIYDSNSDVDLMIVFDHEICGVLPETYRKWLKDFANLKYSRSNVVKDFPTVVIDMLHLKLDLVPTIIETHWWNGTQIKIPDYQNSWQETAPNEFNNRLTDVNTQYSYIVKPIIRLLKAWNSSNGYPYSSYFLEQMIVNMNFSGDNYQKGFFWAIDHLPTSHLSISSQNKVNTLRNNKDWVIEYLNREDMTKAKQWLHKIIPSW
ncbi:MAG: SMODS domain-containing nucleotidyltransferase [Aureispira sp.]